MPWRRIPHLIEQAYTQAGHGDYAAAAETMRQALAMDTENAEVYACLAQFLLWDEKEKAAYIAVQRALELDPDMAFIQRVAGDVFAAMLDFNGAEAAYLQAIELDPSDAYAHNALAGHYWQLDRIRKALAWTDKARAIEPENIQTAILRGGILLEIGRTDEAAQEAKFALRQDPEDYAACLLMAETALIQNRLPEAHDLAVSALMRNPRDDDACVLLAKIKSRQNPILGLWWRLHLLLRPLRTTWGTILCLAGLAIFAFLMDDVKRGGVAFGLLTPAAAAAVAHYSLAASAVILSLGSIVLLGHFVTGILIRREIRKVELDGSF